MHMLYKVYVLYSPNHDRLFTGMTTSLSDRMISHNGDAPDDWTSGYKPWTLVHMELFDEEELKQQAAEMGKGVEYIRGEKIEEGGREGYYAVFK